MRLNVSTFILPTFLLLSCGCSSERRPDSRTDLFSSQACAVALAPHDRDGTEQDRIDQKIARLQEAVRGSRNTGRILEQLGWLYVSKARTESDEGFYKLAEKCAECIEEQTEQSAGALLLKGHVLHQLHRFKEAEQIARQLASMRESPFDHGLLGDVLMEQGKVDEAAVEYQAMVNLKPSLQSYSRVAHLRWLQGDIAGARQLMRMAVAAASPRDAESAAWAYARLALYQFQGGALAAAIDACDLALSYQPNHPAALLAKGRILWAMNRREDSVESLERAARIQPLPEYLWTLADALRGIGKPDEARGVESRVLDDGAMMDPRTLSLYLSTRGSQLATALELAEQELTVRSDVFTLDSYAWALAANGKLEEADAVMERALSVGTQDARLYLHAGVVAASRGDAERAQRWLEKAKHFRQMLLPSEQSTLAGHLESL